MPIISMFANGGVSSFNGRYGKVSPQEGDYTASMVGAASATTKVNGLELSGDVDTSLISYDKTVTVGSWVADTTYPQYGYRAPVAIGDKILSSMIPDVMFAPEQQNSGLFSSTANSYNGGVYIYASAIPQTSFVIPTIVFTVGKVLP